jgi:uncharacterized protein YdeI (YjbR/CyaY-like superfamily)
VRDGATYREHMTAMDHAERFHPESQQEWRQWLERHHGRGDGVWLVTWRRESGRPVLEYEESVLEALCFGWIDSTRKVIDADRVMMWFAPRRPQSTWVRNNKDRIARLEAEGRLQEAGRALVEAAKANGMWTVFDDAEAGVVHPDLAARLAVNPRATAAWEALTPAARRRHLMDLALARTPATLTKRVETVMGSLSTGSMGRAASGTPCATEEMQMSQTPSEDNEPDQDAGPPVGAPAPDPGGPPVTPGDGSDAGRVDPEEADQTADDET